MEYPAVAAYLRLLALMGRRHLSVNRAVAVPVVCNKENINAAAFTKKATGEWAVHLVNNGASSEAVISGLPASTKEVAVYVTNSHSHAEVRLLKVTDGRLSVQLPAESFVSIITATRHLLFIS